MKEMMEKSIEVSKIMKFISHEARLKILCYLTTVEKAPVEDITKCAGISQSQTSQFLGKMKDFGLVDYSKDKNKVLYFIKDNRVSLLMEEIKNIFC